MKKALVGILLTHATPSQILSDFLQVLSTVGFNVDRSICQYSETTKSREQAFCKWHHHNSKIFSNALNLGFSAIVERQRPYLVALC
jgi:hypothetical protein